jgi:hypothetical protein
MIMTTVDIDETTALENIDSNVEQAKIAKIPRDEMTSSILSELLPTRLFIKYPLLSSFSKSDTEGHTLAQNVPNNIKSRFNLTLNSFHKNKNQDKLAGFTYQPALFVSSSIPRKL